MKIRDRIREFRRVAARELRPNPRNWRTHPAEQRDVLRGVLSEIGYADALLARECPDGSLELIDGHLRAETTPDQEVPVLVLDLDQTEADKLLTLLDPLASLASADASKRDALLAEIETESDAVKRFLETLARNEQDSSLADERIPEEVAIPELYQVVVECDDEAEQREVYEELVAGGRRCRLSNL
jgi:hypothetical protein